MGSEMCIRDRISPKNIEALAGMGDAFYVNGMFEKSAEAYEAALEVSPGYERAIEGLERIQEVTGGPEGIK